MTEFENILDKILHHFAGPDFTAEVERAKKEFFENSGILDEKSEQYELRMSQFFDWYFFTRELSGFALTPLEANHLVRELRFTDVELSQIERLKNHRHGLFEFIKIKGSDVYLKDLFKNEKIWIRNSPWTDGFSAEELFEARLIPNGDSFMFTRGFCFHPAEAKKYILAEVKRHRKDPDLNPDNFMLKLIKMRYKFEQYRHVKISLIYANDNKLGV
jgi:hypothetical protein